MLLVNAARELVKVVRNIDACLLRHLCIYLARK